MLQHFQNPLWLLSHNSIYHILEMHDHQCWVSMYLFEYSNALTYMDEVKSCNAFRSNQLNVFFLEFEIGFSILFSSFMRNIKAALEYFWIYTAGEARRTIHRNIVHDFSVWLIFTDHRWWCLCNSSSCTENRLGNKY